MSGPPINIFRLFSYSLFLFLLLILPVYHWGTIDALKAYTLGYIVSIFNIFSTLISIRWGFFKKSKQFYRVLIGGMVLRLVIVAIFVYLLIKVLQWPVWGFVIALMLFHLFLQYHEIKIVAAVIKAKK